MVTEPCIFKGLSNLKLNTLVYYEGTVLLYQRSLLISAEPSSLRDMRSRCATNRLGTMLPPLPLPADMLLLPRRQ